jgi:hypothetical protein
MVPWDQRIRQIWSIKKCRVWDIGYAWMGAIPIETVLIGYDVRVHDANPQRMKCDCKCQEQEERQRREGKERRRKNGNGIKRKG